LTGELSESVASTKSRSVMSAQWGLESVSCTHSVFPT